MRFIRHVVRSLLLLALLAFSGGSLANPDNAFGDGPHWACWYAPTQLTVQCLLIHAPTQGQMERALEVANRVDRRLPALVRTIWGNPEQLAGTHISIPLMTDPFDMEFVGLLARSAMCGSRKDCSVSFDRNSDGYAPVRAAALESGRSQSEVIAEIGAQGLVLAQEEPVARPGSTKRKPG